MASSHFTSHRPRETCPSSSPWTATGYVRTAVAMLVQGSRDTARPASGRTTEATRGCARAQGRVETRPRGCPGAFIHSAVLVAPGGRAAQARVLDERAERLRGQASG